MSKARARSTSSLLVDVFPNFSNVRWIVAHLLVWVHHVLALHHHYALAHGHALLANILLVIRVGARTGGVLVLDVHSAHGDRLLLKHTRLHDPRLNLLAHLLERCWLHHTHLLYLLHLLHLMQLLNLLVLRNLVL